MTDEEIKKMLKDIIDNGAEYEYRKLPQENGILCNKDCTWYKFQLGDTISSQYEYRKVEKWYVSSDTRLHKDNLHADIAFSETKEECEKWISEHTKKSWLEKYLQKTPNVSFRDSFNAGAECGVEAVCRKILKELYDTSLDVFDYEKIRAIIKNLGVKI